MGLESTTTIAGLRQDWPLGLDPHHQGDDHLTLIKSVLKSSFPGSGGQGFNKPIIATEDDLNATIGARYAFQTQIDEINGVVPPGSFPQGTRMVFHQPSAPEGWQQDTNSIYHDHMMRIVTDSAGQDAHGTDTPIHLSKVAAHTHGAGVGASGDHDHSTSVIASSTLHGGSESGAGHVLGFPGTNVRTSMDGNHSHTISIATNDGSSDWFPKYTNLIIAVKL